jgi:hypothetical protein
MSGRWQIVRRYVMNGMGLVPLRQGLLPSACPNNARSGVRLQAYCVGRPHFRSGLFASERLPPLRSPRAGLPAPAPACSSAAARARARVALCSGARSAARGHPLPGGGRPHPPTPGLDFPAPPLTHHAPGKSPHPLPPSSPQRWSFSRSGHPEICGDLQQKRPSPIQRYSQPRFYRMVCLAFSGGGGLDVCSGFPRRLLGADAGPGC